MADDVADNWIGGEGADFVEDWCDGFSLELVGPASKLDIPKLQYHGVFTVAERVFAKLFVSEHASNIEHGSLGPV